MPALNACRWGDPARLDYTVDVGRALARLLDPRHLGGFRAVLAGRGLAAGPPLRGLAFRMRGRR